MRSFLYRIYFLLRYPIMLVKRNSISFTTNIGPNVLLANCNIGRFCYIGRNSVLNSVTMGNYCSIAPSVQIGGMEHSYNWLSTSTFLSNKNIDGNCTKIGNDVWVAAGAIIKQGVTIGNGAVVGACSFVNKDVPPYAIVVGSPARIIKYRFCEKTIQVLESSQYWRESPQTAKKLLKKIETHE